MNYIEELGLIKIDLLSLSNLSTIAKTLELININKHVDIKLIDIDLDDVNVYRQLANGDTSGIFQLESPGMTNLLRRINPKNIEDIAICSALFRPGPQTQINTYLENKQNIDKIVYIDEAFKKSLSPTYNVIIYQEQLMKIVKNVANYSMSEADTFRKIISKKQMDKMKKLENDFKQAAIKNGYSIVRADEIYKYIEAFANYGFNHSHAIAYSYISY
jgi:DNA polymerase-3 subunit alpha